MDQCFLINRNIEDHSTKQMLPYILRCTETALSLFCFSVKEKKKTNFKSGFIIFEKRQIYEKSPKMNDSLPNNLVGELELPARRLIPRAFRIELWTKRMSAVFYNLVAFKGTVTEFT